MSSNEPVIDVRGVGKRYDIYDNPRDRLKQLVMPKLTSLFGRSGPSPTYHREFWALHDISFQVRPGETLGIIGRNGGGKSTLLQILAGTLAPTAGDLTVRGRVAALLELGSGFNPDFTGRENVLLNARILGLSREQIDASYDEIVAFADIGDFIDQPVKTYSSGMFVRLAFAVQAHINASIVIIDEALAVGDVFFRQKCYARLEEIRASGAAVLLVSHAMTDIEQFCDRAILLDHGRMNFIGGAAEAAKRYYQLHQTGQSFSTIPFANNPEGIQSNLSNASDITVSESAPLPPAINITQVGNGWAECLGFSVYDTQGEPCHHFSQGQVAVFVSEFRILKDIGMATCGVVLHNERGITVHGKSSVEHGVGTKSRIKAGTVVRCKQEISLNLQLGEYTFEIGLGAIEPDTFSRMSELTHEAIDASVIHLCVLPKAGSLSIGWASDRKGSALSHHGIADLPGSIEFSFPDFS
ncbi:ABC transporter ATP-binding protein [Agrobacterium sp. rho-8.1]|nr:ABC transporter ATP-binding protein [Agrobacterium sp. rho-8.1]